MLEYRLDSPKAPAGEHGEMISVRADVLVGGGRRYGRGGGRNLAEGGEQYDPAKKKGFSQKAPPHRRIIAPPPLRGCYPEQFIGGLQDYATEANWKFLMLGKKPPDHT